MIVWRAIARNRESKHSPRKVNKNIVRRRSDIFCDNVAFSFFWNHRVYLKPRASSRGSYRRSPLLWIYIYIIWKTADPDGVSNNRAPPDSSKIILITPQLLACKYYYQLYSFLSFSFFFSFDMNININTMRYFLPVVF